MSLLVLSALNVNAVISELQPNDLEALMASIFHKLPSRSDYGPHTEHPCRWHDTRHSSCRLAYQTSERPPKVVSVPSLPGDRQGFPAPTLVLDELTGRVKVIVNATGAAPTALRTAADADPSSPLVSKVPTTLVAFGAGKQSKAHVDLPSFQSCTIVNRTDNARLRELALSLRRSGPSVAIDAITLDDSDRVKHAVWNADVIRTATSSEDPFFPLLQ